MYKFLISILFCSFVFTGCAPKELPGSTKVISNFDLKSYLGLWYEIAHYKNSKDKDQKNITYEYFLDKAGIINAMRNSQSSVDKSYKNSQNILKFDRSPKIGMLTIEGFPKNESYNILRIDADYNYALVLGSNLSEFRILSRTKSIPELIKSIYIKDLKNLGYDIENIAWVTQE